MNSDGEMVEPFLAVPTAHSKRLSLATEICGGRMFSGKSYHIWLPILLVSLATITAGAQSFRVQCPTTTITHPTAANLDPAYTGPTNFAPGPAGYLVPNPSSVNGAIKCQQISGGDGFATMGDGTQTYMFSFGPLSGLSDIANGLPGTQFPDKFNSVYNGTLLPGDPATTGLATFKFNGAVGLVPNLDCLAENAAAAAQTPPAALPCPNLPAGGLDGHVDPRPIMDIGVLNGNIPAPLMALDEDDEFFLTLTNVGQIMRPDLFEQHTVHFHGYPNASAFYDGVPDASVAINIGGSLTYYYLAPDAGTYFWHCHITPPEHLQMGMVGQIYVRPRQNRVAPGADLFASLQKQQGDLRTACRRPSDGVTPSVSSSPDILCSNPLPAVNTHAAGGNKYAYNDGDGTTADDVEYPLHIHGLDPTFHFDGMTYTPDASSAMKDKNLMLTERSHADTATTAAI